MTPSTRAMCPRCTAYKRRRPTTFDTGPRHSPRKRSRSTLWKPRTSPPRKSCKLLSPQLSDIDRRRNPRNPKRRRKPRTYPPNKKRTSRCSTRLRPNRCPQGMHCTRKTPARLGTDLRRSSSKRSSPTPSKPDMSQHHNSRMPKSRSLFGIGPTGSPCKPKTLTTLRTYPTSKRRTRSRSSPPSPNTSQPGTTHRLPFPSRFGTAPPRKSSMRLRRSHP